MRARSIPATRSGWMDLALGYCSRRETSRAILKRYLLRKMREYGVEEEHRERTEAWINEVLDECERLKVVEDVRYAGILHREYQRRGKGRRYIEQKLSEKGLKTELSGLSFDAEGELERACEAASKALEKAAFRKIEDPRKLRTRLLQKLVGAGFDLGTAKKAVDSALKNGV
jgi:SOS response regulatory protein OraA/RecX